MANLDDLGFTSITEMNNDEALELLRQIRLSRRTSTKTVSVKKAKEKTAPKLDINQATELLKLLTGGKK